MWPKAMPNRVPPFMVYQFACFNFFEKTLFDARGENAKILKLSEQHMKHIGVYRYTSAYTGIPFVYRCGGIPSSYFTDIFMDFSEFKTNFHCFLVDFVICSQILTNFRHLSEIC